MSKRALLRLATSFCFMLSVIFLGHTIVFADEVAPIHEYNFDNDKGGNIFDSVKTGGKNGRYTNDNESQFVTGYDGIGKAKHFEVNGDGIYFNQLLIPEGAKSIRFKIRKDASTVIEKSEPIINSSNASSGLGFYLGVGSRTNNVVPGSIYVSSDIGNTTKTFEMHSPQSICDGQWHDVLFTWDGTQKSNSVKLYIDDMTTPVVQTTAAYPYDKIPSPSYIGGSQYKVGLKDLLFGDLDDVKIYNVAIVPETAPVTSPNLKATAGDSKVDLAWDAVTKATNYTIKRATTAGGPYTTVSNITDVYYTDTDVTNGTTYYYVISATNNDKEITNSNEASAQPTRSQTPPTTEAKLKVVLEVSEALRLSVDDNLNINTQMSWSSSEATVATVNEKGIVTALAPGNTVITVKSVDGSYTDYINVLVVENADDYRLAIDLKVGETARLTADDFTNTANITWAPMDSSIANVTSKGKVTALSKGLVLISAKDAEGNIIGRVYVRVRE